MRHLHAFEHLSHSYVGLCDNLFSHGTSRVESIQRSFRREEAKDHRSTESHLELTVLVHLLERVHLGVTFLLRSSSKS
jgi:hypothetical protein